MYLTEVILSPIITEISTRQLRVHQPPIMSKTKVERYVSPPGGVFPATRRRRSPRNVKSCNGVGTLGSTGNCLLPADLQPLDNQVAGHMYNVEGNSVGMLKHKDDFVLKPITKPMLGEREIRFYEELQNSSDQVFQELRLLVPGFHGRQTISVSGQNVTCLVLDDVTKGFKEPCIMDIKIGKRTWDPLATVEKMQNEDKKYVDCRKAVGFCIPGFQVRNIKDGMLYKFGKDYGKNLNGETVKDALRVFLNADSGLCRPLLVQFLGLLWRILNWCRKQKKIRLYSSSLLLVYDARLLRHYIKSKTEATKMPLSPEQLLQNNRSKRNNRPPSLAVTESANNTNLLSPGFSGQFTADGPKFERSLSVNSSQLSPANPVSNNNNCPWKKSLRKLQRTHSFSHNYEEDLKHLKQNYVYMLDDLVADRSNLWANVKMIDFAHVFSAEGNCVDSNYLEGVENLVKMFENLLQEAS